MSKLSPAAAVLGCLLVAVSACAHHGPPRGRGEPREDGGGPPGGPPGGPRGDAFRGGLIADPVSLLLADFDANRDHRVTKEELQAGLDAAWRELDRDRSGAASPIELADWMKSVMGSETATPGRLAFDRDADGKVTREELWTELSAELERHDADHDGAVTRAELVRLVEPMGMGMGGGPRTFQMQRGGQGGGPGGGGPGGGGGGQGGGGQGGGGRGPGG